ncbi:MAG: efflux RND transporter periplasmic adaptor subunit [Bacteroidales bacterium]|nr:efflux RND transporter periplasmic adaptor subunit [Bacteroidales bacterium]
MQNPRLLPRKYLYGGIALFLISGWVILSLIRGERGALVTIVHPSIQAMTEQVPANGYLRPLIEIALSPDVSGEIVNLYVREGDQVQKGDLLLKIRQDSYLAAVDQAEASLQAIQAQLKQESYQFEQQQRRYERSRMLFEQGSISKVEYEDAEAEFRLAECRLETATHNVANAKASRNQARENLRKTFVYAPMEGIVSRLNVEQGERVVGTSQMAGTEMLRIADFRQMEVRVEVTENDILKIKLGDTAQVFIDAYPQQKFQGIVTQLANSASYSERNTGIPVYPVRILLLEDSYAELLSDHASPFRPGMSANIEIETQKKEDVLTLPLSCFVQRPGSKQAQVFIRQADGIARLRSVRVGMQDLERIEILSGIRLEDEIISGPYSLLHDRLNDGDFVSLQYE